MAGAEVKDEFTAPGSQAGLLELRRLRVQQLFAVSLTVLSSPDPLELRRLGNGDERIWVQLRGCSESVRRAKEYIKGVCEPELELKIYYPKEMHCIFAGAQNIFFDSLIRDTCANVSMPELGTLRINGCEEAVVLAESRIQQFVQLFESNLSLPDSRESAAKKMFKRFVETHADKYTMDLLLLPSSLKEELLNLTSHSKTVRAEDHSDLSDLEIVQHSCTRKRSLRSEDGLPLEEVRSKAGTPVSELTKQMDTVLSESARKHFAPVNAMHPIQESGVSIERPACKRRCSDVEERRTKKQFSFESQHKNKRGSFGTVTVVDVVDLLSDSCSDLEDSVIFVKDYDVSEETEYKILVNFFKTMGYSKEIVEMVIDKCGQSEEPLKLLDEIEKEHTRVHDEKEAARSCVPGSTNILRDISANKINISQSGKNSPILNGDGSNKYQPDCPTGKTQSAVVCLETDGLPIKPKLSKRAFRTAANFSVQATSSKMDSSCKEGSNGINTDLETDCGSVSNFTVQELVSRNCTSKDTDFIASGSSNPPSLTVVTKPVTLRKDSPRSSSQQNNGCILQVEQRNHLNPCHIKTAILDPTLAHQKPVPNDNATQPKPTESSGTGSQRLNDVAPTVNIERPNPIGLPGPGSQQCLVPAPVVTVVKPYTPDALRFLPPVQSTEGLKDTDPSVTGRQRFLNTIKVPFKLELHNEPARADLKHIIIDGSNVAMSHGLRQYFSCRGIALAVEYFWKHGHRNITVFVPQWRTRRDPNITEQHFLQQLEDLGILSFTPARMVLGSRIASHDDRFLLHLSDKTGGIIVTNDNFREFVTESPAWKQIIKERILQFTFAGDIFMVPDDPLGRHGPKLQDFLRQQPQIQQTHFQQPYFQPMHFQLPQFQQPHFSNLPGARLLMDSKQFPLSGPSISHLTGAATSAGIQPQLKQHVDPRFCGTPQLQKIQPSLTIPPQRTAAESTQLKVALLNIFPDSQPKIDKILTSHPYMRDLNALSAMVLD